MIEDITVVIAIGGEGSRLKKISGEIPKPLFPICGISTLERALNELDKYGFKKVILSTCFRKELFKDFIKNNTFNFDKLIIFEEELPLGECGCLWEIKDQLSSKTLFINGDLIFSLDFKKLCAFDKNLGSDITLVTHPSSHPEDSDMISAPNGSFVEKLFLKNRDYKEDKFKPLLGFAGISLFKTSIIDEFKLLKNQNKYNLFGFLFKKAFENKKKIFSYNTSEYIKDMGTEKRYLEVTKAINKNILEMKNYTNFQKALFIDRDNTLIECNINNYILCKDEIKFLDKNIEKLAKLSTEFSVVSIVTNQPQIAMNKLSLEELESINNYIIYYCRAKSLLIDTVVWCPHHPHKGYDSENKILKTDCFCRKPKPGMLLQLAYERNIDLKSSLFVGDSYVDEEASKSAGCSFINILNL